MMARCKRKGWSLLRHRFGSAILVAVAASLSSQTARAVVVRGAVRDGLGQPVPGARVQLIFGQTTATYAVSSSDGTFEIRDGDAGRFVLLTSASTFAPQISASFYGGRTDIVLQDVVLSPTEIRTTLAQTASGLPTPLLQLTAPTEFLSRDALSTREGITDALRLLPGVTVIQQGQAGGPAALLVQGGGPDANKVLSDGMPANDVGGRFDYSTIATTALNGPGNGAAVEAYRGANTASAGTDALAGVVALRTAEGTELRPVLNYVGDAGNLHTWRNEAEVSGTLRKLDYLGAISRFDTSNALQNDRFHLVTAAANVGYAISARTPLRLILRDSTSAVGLPSSYDFHHLTASGKQADQDLYGSVSVENTTLQGWHNLLRYGIARKRRQTDTFDPVGELVDVPSGSGTVPTYFGLNGTIRGANGYTATGQAAFDLPAAQEVSNRDQLEYRSDDLLPKGIGVAFAFRYSSERGLFRTGSTDQTLDRTNFGFHFGVQGGIQARLAYSAAFAIEDNGFFGIKVAPRVGLSYQLLKPYARPLRGTRLYANVATGIEEPSLALQYGSLYQQLLQAGQQQLITQYGITPALALRSRTLSAGLEQNLLGERLKLRADYFHNQFSHQVDTLDAGTLQHVFQISTARTGFIRAGANSLAFLAQGATAELIFQPAPRLLLRAEYMYLATRVEQSITTTLLALNPSQSMNPSLPGTLIGGTAPLVGGRVFGRPPQSGLAEINYTGSRFTASLQASAQTRADDSTFLSFADRNGGNSLLLPNRDLDFAFVKLDLGATYSVTKRIGLDVQLNNLLNNQHIGPIGYPAIPLTVRAGLRLRLGGY